MIRIRFFRAGRKSKPFYKIVVTNSKNAPSAGRFIEDLGFYDPVTKDCKINNERVGHWIKEGASVSDTVHNLLVRKQVIIGKKIPVHSVSKKEPVEEKKVATDAPEEITEKKEVVEEPKKKEVVEEKKTVTETLKEAEEKEVVEEPAKEEPAEEKKPKE